MSPYADWTDEQDARWTAAMGSSNGGDPRHDAEPETEEAPALPQLMTARDICELPDPPASDELLGPLFTRGNRVVIGAHTGAGKTTITKQVVRTIVNGGDFLGWNAPGGGRALIIDAEQGLRTIKLRLREAGQARKPAQTTFGRPLCRSKVETFSSQPSRLEHRLLSAPSWLPVWLDRRTDGRSRAPAAGS